MWKCGRGIKNSYKEYNFLFIPVHLNSSIDIKFSRNVYKKWIFKKSHFLKIKLSFGFLEVFSLVY